MVLMPARTGLQNGSWSEVHPNGSNLVRPSRTIPNLTWSQVPPPCLSSLYHTAICVCSYPSFHFWCAHVSISLIIRDDPFAVSDYIANYITKRYRKHPSFLAYDSVLIPSINDFAPTANKPFMLGFQLLSYPNLQGSYRKSQAG